MTKLLRKVFDSFFLTRPMVHIPVWTIVLLGALTASPHKLLQLPGLSPLFWIGIVAFTCIVAHIYIVNQIRDRESDHINGKLFILPEKHLSIRYAWLLAIVFALIGVVLSVVWCDSGVVIIVLLALLLGYFYNNAPFYLKDRPWGGLIANLLGHGMLSYYIGWYMIAQPETTQEILLGVWYSLSAGFANAAVYLTSTIPDIAGDKAVGKNTFAVVYGKKRCSLVASIAVTLSFVAAFVIPYNSWIMIMPAVMSTGVFWWYYYKPVESVAITFRWPVAFLGVVIGLYVPLFILVVIVLIISSRFYYAKRFGLKYPSIT